MTDTFEHELAAGLRRYADARVRPIDVVSVAAASVASIPAPRLRWWPRGAGRAGLPAERSTSGFVRGLALGLAIGVIAMSAVLLVSGAGTAPRNPASMRPATVTPVPTRGLVSLVEGSWGLDFAASGLGSHPDEGIPSSIASAIHFTEDTFDGATGYGGGCDFFRGTYVASLIPGSFDGALRLTFDELRQGCAAGSPQTLIERLVGSRHFGLADCRGGTPAAPVSCAALVISGALGHGELIYRK
jgi:hypothetical protein